MRIFFGLVSGLVSAGGLQHPSLLGMLVRRPASGRGYWLSIFMVDLKSDYIWVRSIDLMDFKRLDPINNSTAPEATLPPVSR